ncbi:TonB-dependent receptor domain-containing protein [uncultured Bacteroides sp.]|uniref:TonB-dependent receptor n=1 Tax=uncultured Bacteroides sp. TaxID=162156 RepID=UPI002AA5FCD3|nr:TonB-dependent receptor [uncultured Bacteroides sp.]
MKKKVQMLVGLTLIGSSSFAQVKDSLRLVRLQEVQVVGTRATAKTPVAFSNVSKEQIRKQNFGQDIPFLLTMTPSVVVTSDAGAGVGYTGIRVRGTDASRINVTANGVPMNDAESHTLYWVDMPDFASSIEDIQIQRGAGTSTNGAGAFGGSINMKTESISALPYAEVNGSYGSFNTHKETFKVGTGLLKSRWAFDARISNIGSDGYIDRASTNMKSFFAQAGYYGDNDILKFIVFGGKEKTYHAWNGISKSQLEKDRRYNTCGEITDVDGNVTGFYKDQTDNYIQTNYQMLYTHIFLPAWNMNVTLHYTDGEGYYQEYKNGRTLKEYGLQPWVYYGKLIEESDLVRQKKMDNGFGGGVFSLNYSAGKLQASFGGAANEYKGNNFGKVIWIKNYFNTQLDPDHEYYRNNSDKTDANVYLKANYELLAGLNAYGDLQYRHIHYTIDGLNDKWDWTKTPGGMQTLAVDNNYNFFNPKAGLFWQMNKNNTAYASFSVAQKEPTRNNFTDAKFGKTPSSERLFDYEAGYTYNDSRFLVGVNFYYMKYKDQLILTGQTNDIGEPLADNVPDSYRAGMEYMLGAKITSWLRWDGNATFSQNKIKNYTEYLDNYDANWKPLYTQTARYVGKTTIAYSPDVIANSMITLTFKNWDAALQSSYVSKQFLNNSEQEDCKLDAYFVNNLRLGYTFSLPAVKSIHVGLSINNLFNEKYESNGWGGSSYVIDADGSKTRYNDAGYFAQAGTNILAGITLKF